MAVAAVVLALGLSACSRAGEPQQIGQSPGGQSGGTVAPATTAAPAKCPTEPVSFSGLAPWTQVTTGQAGTPDRWESTFTISNPTALPALFDRISATLQVQRAGVDRVGVVHNSYLTQKAVDYRGREVDQVVVQPRSTATVTISADMVRGATFTSRDLYGSGYLMTSQYWFDGLGSIDKGATCPLALKGAQPISALPADAPTCRLGGPKYPC